MKPFRAPGSQPSALLPTLSTLVLALAAAAVIVAAATGSADLPPASAQA